MPTHRSPFSPPRPGGPRAWLLLALAAALAGCATRSPPVPAEPELALPAQWSHATNGPASADASPLAQWWQRFNDPLLSSLVQQALQANTSVRSAQAALRQSRALRDLKASELRPTLSAGGSAQRSQNGEGEASNSLRLGLDARWEADLFGAKGSALDASEADLQVAQATLAEAQVSLAAEVALAYIQLRAQQAQLAIARSNLEAQQETLQLTEWRAQAGLITSLEVEQARSATAQTRAQLPSLEAGITKTGHALAVLTGRTPQDGPGALAQPLPIPQAGDQLTLAIPAQTLRQRADVRAAEQRIAAALARVSGAQAARYPSFSLSGSLALNATTLAALSNGASAMSTLLGAISVPLLDGGAIDAQVQAQEAALEQARLAYRGVILTALQEVEDALVALAAERSRLSHLQQAASAAEQAALLAQHRYRGGLIDFQTVLQTQRTLLTTQDGVAASQADLGADQVRLYKALGGGWN